MIRKLYEDRNEATGHIFDSRTKRDDNNELIKKTFLGMSIPICQFTYRWLGIENKFFVCFCLNSIQTKAASGLDNKF